MSRVAPPVGPSVSIGMSIGMSMSMILVNECLLSHLTPDSLLPKLHSVLSSHLYVYSPWGLSLLTCSLKITSIIEHPRE